MEDHRGSGDGSGLPGPYGVIMPGLDRWKEHSAPATDIERMDMKFGDKTVVEACLGVGISRKIIEVSISSIRSDTSRRRLICFQELLLLETDRFLIVYDENALRLHGEYLEGLTVYAAAFRCPSACMPSHVSQHPPGR